jgi:GT2 family glycosyltransferase
MKTGIIILNYNDKKTTKEMVDQIKDYKSIDHIVVVDNGSKDNSYEELSKIKLKKLEVIQTDKNRGYAYGNNFGFNYLYDKYNIDIAIISNPDIIVSDDTISGLKKDLEDNNISVIAPLINERGKKIKGYRFPKLKDELLSNILYFHRYVDLSIKSDKEMYPVDYTHGCFFMIKAKDFKKVDMFDENTFLYYEEVILGKKLKDRKLNVYIDTRYEITHNLSVSVNKSFNSINKYKMLKKSQKYFVKNYLKTNIFGRILLAVLYYVSLFFAYIVRAFRRK